MNDSFNIFEILSKDDKELSHSSFIKFLLDQEDGFFLEQLFGVKEKPSDIILEHSLILKREKEKNKKLRLDILLKFHNKTIAIENKFKCLPTVKQLENYTKALSDNTDKYLFYFAEGNDFKLPADWKTITYQKFYNLIIEYLEWLKSVDITEDSKRQILNEKIIFIQHYKHSLKIYIDRYHALKESDENQLLRIFTKPQNRKEEIQYKFWLKLMYHELALLLNKEELNAWVDSGSTYLPVINVPVPEWKSIINGNSYEFVIQLNGSKLKFYAHLNNLNYTEKEEVFHQVTQKLQKEKFGKSGTFKKSFNRENKTCYIYQEDILDVLKKQGTPITLDNIKRYILDFIKTINEALLKEAKSEHAHN